MKERPILFSGPMVRAILEGRKTQTRRVVKDVVNFVENGVAHRVAIKTPKPIISCPYGKPGDRLWVRETFQPVWISEEGDHDYKTGNGWSVSYPATDGRIEFYDESKEEISQACKPSIFMPRWASRITLEIVQVRVERLQDITEADAIAEGIRHELTGPSGRDYYDCGMLDKRTGMPICLLHTEARTAFFHLWKSINGAASFAANPWVWVIEFNRAKQ